MDKDIEKNINDDAFFADESEKKEYERAMAVLNTSKSTRVREINTRKKTARKETLKSKKTDSALGKFIAKCREDIVIPICIIALIVVIVGAVAYVVVPMLNKDNDSDLGLTYAELSAKYTATDVYSECSLGDYGFAVPASPAPVDDASVTDNPVNDSEYIVAANNADLLQRTGLDTWIYCSSDKQDGKLSEIRACIAFDQDNAFIDSWIMFYFVSYIQVFDDTLSSQDAMELISNAGQYLGSFYEVGDVSFSIRLINDTTPYYCLQIVSDDLAEDYVEYLSKPVE